MLSCELLTFPKGPNQKAWRPTKNRPKRENRKVKRSIRFEQPRQSFAFFARQTTPSFIHTRKSCGENPSHFPLGREKRTKNIALRPPRSAGEEKKKKKTRHPPPPPASRLPPPAFRPAERRNDGTAERRNDGTTRGASGKKKKRTRRAAGRQAQVPAVAREPRLARSPLANRADRARARGPCCLLARLKPVLFGRTNSWSLLWFEVLAFEKPLVLGWTQMPEGEIIHGVQKNTRKATRVTPPLECVLLLPGYCLPCSSDLIPTAHCHGPPAGQASLYLSHK